MFGQSVVLDCSGNGHLVGGRCLCDFGWSDVGDFSSVSGLDCGINEQSIEALSIVSLILGVLSMVVFLHFLCTTLAGPRRKHDGPSLKLRFAYAYTLQTTFCNIYDIAQIINQKDSIYGKSIYITILMSIAYGVAYGGCVVFFEAVLVLLKGIVSTIGGDAQGRVNATTKVFYSRTKYLYAICFIESLLSLLSLVVAPEDGHVIVRCIFSLWLVFHVAFMASFNPPINVLRAELASFVDMLRRAKVVLDTQMKTSPSFPGHTLMPVMEEDPNGGLIDAGPASIRVPDDKTAQLSIDMKRFETVRLHLLAAQVCVNFVMILTSIIYLVWICSDLLIRRSIYVILYCSIGVHIMSVPMLIALSRGGADEGDVSNRSTRPRTINKPAFQFNAGAQPEDSVQNVYYSSRHSSFYEKVVPQETELTEDGCAGDQNQMGELTAELAQSADDATV